jgi:hypothetical protein
MNDEIKRKLQQFVKLVVARFKDKEMGFSIIAVCTTDYINYLISNGIIYLSDKEAYCDYVIDLIIEENKLRLSNFPIVIEMMSASDVSTREYNKKLMMHKENYEYETLSFFFFFLI